MTTPTDGFGEPANTILRELYESVGATTTQHRINVLALKLNATGNFTTDNQEAILACLEYEFLINGGHIQPTLA